MFWVAFSLPLEIFGSFTFEGRAKSGLSSVWGAKSLKHFQKGITTLGPPRPSTGVTPVTRADEANLRRITELLIVAYSVLGARTGTSSFTKNGKIRSEPSTRSPRRSRYRES
ncbi:hypothetical protein OE88DRAFT_1661311 [Heliocybe sulcata]|uniref:Uncharacterized protein n=1 Tax=Heliocybe sulcata TaxID=5364 RepID=A0A5C3N1I7_9AGAM|nr:hypothetical protein OE88DRAFT_1661311 [Heliocybe sulcata]